MKKPASPAILADNPQTFISADKQRQLAQRENELLGNINASRPLYERNAFKGLYAELPPDRQHGLTLNVASKLLEVAKSHAGAKKNPEMCGAMVELAVDALEHHVGAQPSHSPHLNETGVAAQKLAQYAAHWQLSGPALRAQRMALDCQGAALDPQQAAAFAQSVAPVADQHLNATRHSPILGAALIGATIERINGDHAYTHETVNVTKAAAEAYGRFGNSPEYHQAGKALAQTLIETGRGGMKGAKVSAILISAMPTEEVAPLTATWTSQAYKRMVDNDPYNAVTVLKVVDQQAHQPLALDNAWDMLAKRVETMSEKETKLLGFRFRTGLPKKLESLLKKGSDPAP